MTRDEAEALVDGFYNACIDMVHASSSPSFNCDLYEGRKTTCQRARAAVLDAMTADQERPVTETEPQENHVVLVPWPDHDLPWRAAFRLRGRWWYYDSNMAASPAPTV